MNFRVEMMRDPSAFPRAPVIRAQFLEAAATTIRQGMAEKDFRADLDPSWEARMLFAVVDGFLMHAAMDVAFARWARGSDLARDRRPPSRTIFHHLIYSLKGAAFDIARDVSGVSRRRIAKMRTGMGTISHTERGGG
jgi:hypothetical protein